MLGQIESVIFFVADIEAAASWYAAVFDTHVRHENPRFAFIQAPGVLLGFHPVDEKNEEGRGVTVYWEVHDLAATIAELELRGARLYRGPGVTDFGANVAMLLDPFGNTIGLNQSSAESRAAIRS